MFEYVCIIADEVEASTGDRHEDSVWADSMSEAWAIAAAGNYWVYSVFPA